MAAKIQEKRPPATVRQRFLNFTKTGNLLSYCLAKNLHFYLSSLLFLIVINQKQPFKVLMHLFNTLILEIDL